MRIRELMEARRPWKQFRGKPHTGRVSGTNGVVDVSATYGRTYTRRTEVFHGYFVRLALPGGEVCVGENRHSMQMALIVVDIICAEKGWTLLAVGLKNDWSETGLSSNSGWGYHPAFARAVHMLEPFDAGANTPLK